MHNPVYLLRTNVTIKEKSSIPISSSFSLNLWSDLKREDGGGFLIGDSNGKILLKGKGGIKGPSIILYQLQTFHGIEQRVVKMLDGVVAKRIIEYMDYYGKYLTDCSTLVEYLKTGTFVECSPHNQSFTFSAGMNLYEGQKIEQGDSLCVLYYKRGILSHRIPAAIRNSCKGNMGLPLHELKIPLKKRKVTHEELLNLYLSGLFYDYHFMFCLGIDNGMPILIHQLGREEPYEGGETSPAVIVTVGATNMYPSDLPACMFIKKGRK